MNKRNFTVGLTEIVICPECGKAMEDGAHGQAHCFIIPDSIGQWSIDECGWCMTGYRARGVAGGLVEFQFNDYQND